MFIKSFGLVTLALIFLACEKDCPPCNLKQTNNFCLTRNGSSALPDSFKYIRERETNPIIFDTLRLESDSKCFPAIPGIHRVIVQKGDSVVFKSDWIQADAQDCCNVAEPKNVDLTF